MLKGCPTHNIQICILYASFVERLTSKQFCCLHFERSAFFVAYTLGLTYTAGGFPAVTQGSFNECHLKSVHSKYWVKFAYGTTI